jgi:hypothetical protein
MHGINQAGSESPKQQPAKEDYRINLTMPRIPRTFAFVDGEPHSQNTVRCLAVHKI